MALPTPTRDRPLWDAFYEEGRFVMWYPSEALVRFAARNLRAAPAGEQPVLDLGCGNGRNLTFLGREGYPATGIDLSLASLELARAGLAREPLRRTVDLAVASGDRLPFPSGAFAAVISFGVLDHMPFALARALVEESRRVLRPGGHLWLTLRADRDSDFGKGDEVEPGTFIVDDEVERGLPQHFYSKEEILSMLKAFAEPRIELEERILGPDLEHRYSRWYVEARKG